MARSEEALLRRALKRDRTEGQQRQADRNEMKRQALKLSQKVGASESDSNNNKRSRVSDPPRSNQSQFGTEKFDGRHNNRSDRKDRGNGEPRSPRRGSSHLGRNSTTPRSTHKTKKPRHDEKTSKKLVWARQADSKTTSKNQELRQRYRETGGEGMDPEDLERAKLLIARDERKKERKNKKKQKITNDSTKGNEEAQTASDGTVEEGKGASTPKKEGTPADEPSQQPENKTSSKPKKEKNSSQAKRDQNKALRLRYLETNGKGMKEDQIERAKLLIARDEKKQKRRAQKQTGKEKE